MLTKEEVKTNKENFISICKENIHRNGINELLDVLEASDFFEAPCSTKFHMNYIGGLCRHSLNVYEELIELCTLHNISIVDNIESITIMSLFHDICKMNFYGKELKNVKENGQWIQKEQYTINDMLPLGHGEKSCMIIQQYLKLTIHELLAIRWHMGAFDDSVKTNVYTFNDALHKSKFVALLHSADFLASQVIEKDD